MIKQVSHTVTGTGPADFALALDVAYALHEPTVVRAPEVATGMTAARRATVRTRRRTTVRG
ncbi:hypothetical protein [Streptomyces sp. HUAS ZL42]|uniref:hypothetical protein n=1 Tax=Streptomyces sp. HUAS ZL42 TaxID=3231715 RepID=UPI00345E980C